MNTVAWLELELNYHDIAVQQVSHCATKKILNFYGTISWLTLFKGNPKALFSIATTPRCKGRHYYFLWIAPLTLDTYLMMVSVKQEDIKCHIWVFGKTTWDWTPVSQAIVNTLTILPNNFKDKFIWLVGKTVAVGMNWEWLLVRDSSIFMKQYLSPDIYRCVPPTHEYGTRPFLRWVRSQGRSPHASGKAKNTFGPVGIPLFGRLRRQAITPPPERGKSLGGMAPWGRRKSPAPRHTRQNRSEVRRPTECNPTTGEERSQTP